MSVLLQDFYEEIRQEEDPASENSFTSFVRLNPQHPVYKGHFEQMPIAPGVCLIQMIGEILSRKTGRNLVLKQGNNIKFLAFINPGDVPEVSIAIHFKLSGNIVEANATFSHGRVTYVKFKGSFSLVDQS